MDIVSHYHQYFYTTRATTPELRTLAYKIRYEVYYEEYKWPPEQTIERLETDIWDQCAIHGLLFHRPTNQAIGNIRLIPLENEAAPALPIEEHYKEAFEFNDLPITSLRQRRTAEISRMAILSTFRRRPMDKDYVSIPEPRAQKPDNRFSINYMPMCLTFAAISLLMETGLDYGVALMEPRLAKLLTRYGVALQGIGETIEYYGKRAPFLIFPEETYHNLSSDYRNLFDAIRQELIAD